MRDTPLLSHYFDDIFNNAASINDAINLMREKGNIVFFDASKGILKDKFRQTTFAPQPWQHEIMHLAGRFSHTPYGEHFAVLAQRNFEQQEEPINRTLNNVQWLEKNAPAFHSNGLWYNTKQSIYEKPDMAAKRQIKDWQAVYASAVGFWLGLKINEYMEHRKNNTATPRQTAQRLQRKSLNNTKYMAFTPYVEEALDELPAALLQLSKTENRILLSIARDGLRDYARRKNMDFVQISQEAAPFEPRIKLTLEKLHGLIYENIYATRQEQFAHFKKSQPQLGYPPTNNLG